MREPPTPADAGGGEGPDFLSGDGELGVSMTPVSHRGPAVPLRSLPFLSSDGSRIDVVRESAERKTDDLRSLLAAIVETSNDAIYSVSPDGIIATWNRAAELIYGYGADEIVGQPNSILYPSHKLSEEVLVLDRIKRGERLDHYETVRRRKDGREIYVSLTVSPVRDADGRLVAAAKIARDITERKRNEEALRAAQEALHAANEALKQRVAERTRERDEAEEQLRQSQKMETLGQLTGQIAHDFNNLITVISGNLEIVEGLVRKNSRVHRLVNSARDGTEQAARLTARLLAFARQQKLHPETVNPNDVLAEFRPLIVRAAGEAVEVRLDADPALWACEVDSAQLQSAILNLVVNARDAMPDGGILTIATRNMKVERAEARRLAEIAPGPYVCISVRDTGQGIPGDVIGRIFDPFFTTKEAGKGTGLGLSQVYGFVRQSGGTVKVESEVGRGTAFRILLPGIAVAELMPARPEISTSSDELPRGTETVLCVEDDTATLDVVAQSLDDLGYRVLAARDGAEALAILRNHGHEQIHILLSDVVMPRGMTGVELARAAQSLHPWIKVLLMSGYEYSSSDFPSLNKPFRQSELAHKIRVVLDGVELGSSGNRGAVE